MPYLLHVCVFRHVLSAPTSIALHISSLCPPCFHIYRMSLRLPMAGASATALVDSGTSALLAPAAKMLRFVQTQNTPSRSWQRRSGACGAGARGQRHSGDFCGGGVWRCAGPGAAERVYALGGDDGRQQPAGCQHAQQLTQGTWQSADPVMIVGGQRTCAAFMLSAAGEQAEPQKPQKREAHDKACSLKQRLRCCGGPVSAAPRVCGLRGPE